MGAYRMAHTGWFIPDGPPRVTDSSYRLCVSPATAHQNYPSGLILSPAV